LARRRKTFPTSTLIPAVKPSHHRSKIYDSSTAIFHLPARPGGTDGFLGGRCNGPDPHQTGHFFIFAL